MTIPFTKMNGAGNDFILIDNRDLTYSLTKKQIAILCDRHRGIGADGLLAVEPTDKNADFRFRYYNADGGEAEMCGNGARCFGAYTARLLGRGSEVVRLDTVAGILESQVLADSQIRITMSNPIGLELNSPVSVENRTIHNINSGVPHAVTFVNHLSEVDVLKFGFAIRHHPHYAPAGTNVNFAEILAPDHLAIRTYERGVENETLACGTGITACAIIHHLLTNVPSPIMVDVASGDILEVAFIPAADQTFTQITLTGPAEEVFNGEIDL